VRDGYPAGFVTLSGEFAIENRDEIIRLVRNTETAEKQEHPIKRIMKISEDRDEICIETTELHLAQAIGKAVHRAFKGDLDLAFEEDIVRIQWKREK
jgi:hypothetical protein